MSTLTLVLSGFFFLLMQLLLSHRMAIGGIAPDFPILFVVYVGLFRGSLAGTLAGLLVGLFQDLGNPAFLGLNALAKSISGYMVGYVGKETDRESDFLVAAAVFGAVLVHDFIYLVFFHKLHLLRIVRMYFLSSVPTAIYTAPVGVLLHRVWVFFRKRLVRTVGKTEQQ